jgi:hypothetical protein
MTGKVPFSARVGPKKSHQLLLFHHNRSAFDLLSVDDGGNFPIRPDPLQIGFGCVLWAEFRMQFGFHGKKPPYQSG